MLNMSVLSYLFLAILYLRLNQISFKFQHHGHLLHNSNSLWSKLSMTVLSELFILSWLSFTCASTSFLSYSSTMAISCIIQTVHEVSWVWLYCQICLFYPGWPLLDTSTSSLILKAHEVSWVLVSTYSQICSFCSVVGVLDEAYGQLIPLSGVAVQARQSTEAGNVIILCSLAGRYGYSAERA